VLGVGVGSHRVVVVVGHWAVFDGGDGQGSNFRTRNQQHHVGRSSNGLGDFKLLEIIVA
jgi:hypothetical protein